MSEKKSTRSSVNVPVLSFMTRRLIGGHKDEFSRLIGDALDVKVNAKTNMRYSDIEDRAYVHISGENAAHVEAAKRLITELDQNAGIISKNYMLKSKRSITPVHYEMIRSHLNPLLKDACKSINIETPELRAARIPEDMEMDVPARIDNAPKNIPSADQYKHSSSAEGKPKKAGKILTIKFNEAAFGPRNLSQAITYFACKDTGNSYVYAAGPFGGGKTYTPLRAGFEGYNEGRFNEIIIIRPSASTGKDPGAMPGDPRKKMEPYLKGGIASNIEKMTNTNLKFLEDKKVVRAFTPDFERGETYDRAFILVDEPQNLSIEQAELLVGRLGEDSIMVFAGDIGGKQNDLKGQISGLAHLIATQGSAAQTNDALKKHTAYIKFEDGDSSARNPILPHVSHALNNPPSEYAAFLSAFNEAAPNPARAKAVEGAREFAVAQLEKMAENSKFRYEAQIQTAFPSLYQERRASFGKDRPALKIA